MCLLHTCLTLIQLYADFDLKRALLTMQFKFTIIYRGDKRCTYYVNALVYLIFSLPNYNVIYYVPLTISDKKRLSLVQIPESNISDYDFFLKFQKISILIT